MFGANIAISANLPSVLGKKVCRNDETEGTTDCSPTQELDEKFERRFRDDTSNPSCGKLKGMIMVESYLEA